MKKFLGLIAVTGGVLLLVGVATAQWGGGHGPGRWGGMGPGMMGGQGGMGPGMMGSQGGTNEGYGCSGWTATGEQITEGKAKELAQQYADQYLPGYKVERVLPFTGMHHAMYSVELKSAEGELRTFHINPFGYIMPFGGPWRQGS